MFDELNKALISANNRLISLKNEDFGNNSGVPRKLAIVSTKLEDVRAWVAWTEKAAEESNIPNF